MAKDAVGAIPSREKGDTEQDHRQQAKETAKPQENADW
jgi:hypothetical protein